MVIIFFKKLIDNYINNINKYNNNYFYFYFYFYPSRDLGQAGASRSADPDA